MLKANPIDKYLETFEKQSTIKGNKSHLNQYFKIIEADPLTYFQDGRDYNADIEKLWKSMSMSKGYSPGSRKGRLCSVVNFLAYNDVTIKPSLLKILRNHTKQVENVTEDVLPQKQQLKEILEKAPILQRALFLFSISSGMRINEILQLTPDDINTEVRPVRVRVRAETTKTRKPRVTFISDECYAALKKWQRIRNDYLKTAVARCEQKHFVKDANDPNIFPLKYQTAREMWITLLRKVGYNQKDKVGRYKIHIHSLRMFLRTTIANGNGGVSRDVVETLIGHKPYCSTYVRVPEEECRIAYLKAMPLITILNIIDEKVVEEKDNQITTLKSQLIDNELNEQRIIQKVLSILKSGDPTLIQNLMKNVPTAFVADDGSTEL